MIKYICDFKCDLSRNNTRVFDSIDLVDDNQIEWFIENLFKERKELKYKVSRSQQSYINEIKAHNRLYKLGLFKKHTKDVDLEEPIKKSKEIIYRIIGR